MSNNPTPPRIEREALIYRKFLRSDRYRDNETIEFASIDYIRGANNEHTRAVPVVKALFAALGILELKQIEPEMAEEFRKILQTYKSDV